jgi:antitoxin VapB
MIDTNGIYHLMSPPTAKIFTHGRSQAVRLPKEFRFEGKEVRVSKVGDKVILEPLERPKIDVAAWRARLDALGAGSFLLDGVPEPPPLSERDDVSLD